MFFFTFEAVSKTFGSLLGRLTAGSVGSAFSAELHAKVPQATPAICVACSC